MKGRVAMVLVAGALTLAGCGGGASGSGQDYKTGADLAKAAGCSGYVKDDSAPMFTQESGKCQIDGKDVYVAMYASKEQRDNAMKLATAAGASGYFAQGDRWDLQSDDKAALEKGAKAAGGSLTS
jgi:predicted small secreted protein